MGGLVDQTHRGLSRALALTLNARNGEDFASIFTPFFRYPVAHRAVSTLAFIPHSQQCRVAAVDEVNDAHIGFGGVFAVEAAQATSAILFRELPTA